MIPLVVITNKYIKEVSDVEGIKAFATLGLFPASYQVLKNGYKMLTINPNASNELLDKYEELLSFVQKLKEQLKTSGLITFKLRNGNIVTIKNDRFNTLIFS